MKLSACALVALLAGPALAKDTPLDGAAILTVLTDVELVYEDGATQLFRDGGVTIYDNGRQSTGRWAVREDRYCSSWPPSETWACYVVTQSPDGQTIGFVADDGSTTSGHRVP